MYELAHFEIIMKNERPEYHVPGKLFLVCRVKYKHSYIIPLDVCMSETFINDEISHTIRRIDVQMWVELSYKF